MITQGKLEQLFAYDELGVRPAPPHTIHTRTHTHARVQRV